MRPAVEWSWPKTDLVYSPDNNTYYLQEYKLDGSGSTREATGYVTLQDAVEAYHGGSPAYGDWH